MSGASSWESAEQKAQAESAEQGPSDGTQECPLKERHAVEVVVKGMDDQPVAEVAVQLQNDAHLVLRAKTSRDGVVQFGGLDEGTYRLSLWELDGDAWEMTGDKRLPLGGRNQEKPAPWTSPPNAPPAQGFTHRIVQGECVAQLGYRYGFFPETIWDHPRNRALRAERSNLHILQPDDFVFIPAKKPRDIAVRTGLRTTLLRKGVPEELNVRFLRDDDSPRADEPFLLSITTASGALVSDIKGTTDARGFVHASIPPDATVAHIVLGKGSRQEVFELDLGYVNPIDSIAGVQARLNALGYPCGNEDNELGERTGQALRTFQQDRGLEVTGKPDEPTKKKLLEVSLS